LDYDLKTAAVNNRNLSVAGEVGNTLIEVAGKYRSTVVAKNLGMDLTAFNKLNPNFDKLVAMGETYQMKLPSEKANLFYSSKNAILNESVQSSLQM
jgi:membrane-bound lytic murein transglycosylase D